MKNLTTFCIVFTLLFFFNSSYASSCSATKSGNWNTNTIWLSSTIATEKYATNVNGITIIELGLTTAIMLLSPVVIYRLVKSSKQKQMAL